MTLHSAYPQSCVITKESISAVGEDPPGGEPRLHGIPVVAAVITRSVILGDWAS